MNSSALKNKLLREIRLMPDEKVGVVYDFIRGLRFGAPSSSKGTKQVMRFAGCWRDMPAGEFAGYLEDIAKRRPEAFSRRRSVEGRAD